MLIWRRTRSPAALLLLGLQPTIVLTAVNGGHNDVLVGGMLLGAALLAGRRQLALAGAVVGVAVLVKITAGLALLGLVLWLLRRRDWRAAVTAGVPAVAVAVTGYAIAGRAALTALAANTSTISRASLWQLPERALGLEGPGGAFGLRHDDLFGMITTVGSLVVVTLAGRARVAPLAPPRPGREHGRRDDGVPVRCGLRAAVVHRRGHCPRARSTRAAASPRSR